MSRRPRPTDSRVESRLIAWPQSPFAAHEAPTFPALHVPLVQTPATLVTPSPPLG